MAQKPSFSQKSKVARKVWFAF